MAVEPQWIKSVNWSDKTVAASMTRHAVQDAPVYDSQASMSRETEDRLHQHHGHAGYWTGYPVRDEEISRV